MPPEMKNGKTVKELAKIRLALAEEDLATAVSNLQTMHLRGANNRAYYSIYHAITAVLALEGVSFKSHKMTLAYFNKNYVKEEIFPRELGRKINMAEQLRHASDYDEFCSVSEDETKVQIETAMQALDYIKAYLNEKI